MTRCWSKSSPNVSISCTKIGNSSLYIGVRFFKKLKKLQIFLLEILDTKNFQKWSNLITLLAAQWQYDNSKNILTFKHFLNPFGTRYPSKQDCVMKNGSVKGFFANIFKRFRPTKKRPKFRLACPPVYLVWKAKEVLNVGI